VGGFLQLYSLLLFDAQVAKTIGTGIINPSIVDNTLLIATLAGAIIWNLITWLFGLPSIRLMPSSEA
jgi:PiT family inorganic phosphate transporter